MVSENSSNSTDGTSERRITVRRAPRFVPFMVLGGVVGIIVAAFVAFGLPSHPEFDAGAVFGFFTVAFAAGGVILGCIAALILDRLSFKQREHAIVEAVPEDEAQED
ncbi:hypothetical protein BIU82_08110 [Arthrobacter sp. SW1]|uniref:hypothetical protein n=1 Tax=Arthrobacter sp. SW1 TaxID=1920889 RepID=UPI000877BDA9|nr:hypothetical protein [Arthrobacter sp. SW1]OFI37071.1 hypothetical protein BIU82_08110 [Arthrobacter sp. SW1]